MVDWAKLGICGLGLAFMSLEDVKTSRNVNPLKRLEIAFSSRLLKISEGKSPLNGTDAYTNFCGSGFSVLSLCTRSFMLASRKDSG